MPSTLLSVKFFIPQPKTNLTARPHLLDRFTAGLVRPLTLISAPAGFGKSTLLSTWIHQAAARDPQSRVCCWLSLDAADNHPERFWSYFLSALQTGLRSRQTASETIEQLGDLFAILQSDPPILQPVLDQLLNVLAACPERLLLILDDYHHIQLPQIQEQMAGLLDHQPPNLHLVIATRADPPLPITRLRARDQLSEFRAADLRFSLADAALLLHLITGLEVSPAAVNTIQASTEGWPAGLQMAALALQALLAEAPDPSAAETQHKIRAFVQAFSGKHIYILDYLTDEVFDHQPVEVKDFLLKTSILERMSAGLCAALLQPTSDRQELSSTTTARDILEYLDRSNLFLIRLDQERQWFRYHHLFADLLRARLDQTWPDQVPELHRRASHWYAQHGFVDEAIGHALVGQQWEWAAGLMEIHVAPYLERGQLSAVLRWIDALPQPVLYRRPVLCTHVAWALTHAGQFPRVPPLVEAVEAALAARDNDPFGQASLALAAQDVPWVRACIVVLRAFGLFLAGNPAAAFELASHALANLPALELPALAWLNWMCGYAARGMGDLERAVRYFESALSLGRQANLGWEDMATDLAIAYRLSGRLWRAVQVFQEALLRAAEQGGRNRGTLSRVEAFLSAVLLDQNRLDEALMHAQKALDYLQWWPSHNHITTAYAYLALVQLAFGRLAEAEDALYKAQQEQHKGQVMPTVLRLVEHVSVRFWLQRGDWDALERWLAAQQASLADISASAAEVAPRPFTEYDHMHLLSLARVWIAKGRRAGDPVWFEQALALLARLEASAADSHWVHPLIEIHLLQALALAELGRSSGRGEPDFLPYLTHSLALGLPEGYLRIYLQEGLLLAGMLHTWLKTVPTHALPAGLNPLLVKDLLDHFDVGVSEPTAAQPTGARKAGLIEALTEREQAVLQLLALGLSNKEMAQRLVVSEGTIKTHVHNLIGKLGAQSRTHALARARDLHLL